MFGTPGNISIILVSVFCFVYGFFISMGKADWALKNQRKQLFPIDFEKSNIFKVRILAGGLLMMLAVGICIFWFCQIMNYFLWFVIPLVIVYYLLMWTWAKY